MDFIKWVRWLNAALKVVERVLEKYFVAIAIKWMYAKKNLKLGGWNADFLIVKKTITWQIAYFAIN